MGFSFSSSRLIIRSIDIKFIIDVGDDRQVSTLSPKQNLFKAYFQSLIDHECSIDLELKSGALLTGRLSFADNHMCLLLVPSPDQLHNLPPQFKGMGKGIYLRGSAIRMAFLPKIDADLDSLSEFCKST